MAYSISKNSNTGLWEVSYNGIVIGVGATPNLAINNAVTNGGLPNDAEITANLLNIANNLLDTENATTRLNNAGTGQPGTAGQGSTATPDQAQRRASVEPPPVDEFGNLDEAIERQQASEPVLSEDGEVAIGVRRNTETGEIFYTDPPKGDDPPFNEFAGVDEAIIDQEGTGLKEPPVVGDEEVNSYLNKIAAEDPYNTEAPWAEGSSKSIDAQKKDAQSQATIQDTTQFKAKQDWRVRLSLSPGATYLYKAEESKRGILSPLAATDGVIFPYTPSITVNYNAKYEATSVTHSNYLIQQYNSSSVDNIQITGIFTAQDTREANYLLAVIHFFRSVTKMFYGQDQAVKPGTPPPLCYLFGLGAFQFDAHPLAITSFAYSLPDDVDYIKANISYGNAGVNRQGNQTPNNTNNSVLNRLANRIMPGGLKPPAKFVNTSAGTFTGEPTYVPTKISLTINAVPVISRNQISNEFSLEKYATGELLRGTKRSGGGIW